MKTYLKILGLITITFFTYVSCEKIEDVEPLFALDAEEGISDPNTAELALIGAYATFRQSSFDRGTPELFIIPSLFSGQAITPGNDNEAISFVANDPIVDGRINLGAYTRMYDLINRTNWVLFGISNLSEADFENPGRRDEIIGEAKALRALAHFYLLRQWGQFYDLESEFGINIRTEPVRSPEAQPRNSVEETYAQIIQDLDDAIMMAPVTSNKIVANQTFARALKAKVLFYQGDYSNAAALAREVLDNPNGDFALAPTYSEIFDGSSQALFSNSELLFGTQGDNINNEFIGIGNFWGFYASVPPSYVDFATTGALNLNGQNISHDGDRVTSISIPQGPFLFDNGKYVSDFTETYELIYHMRMAELYLIFAEAHARANGSVTTDALNALNAVRIRAGAITTGADGFETYPATISLTQFLEAVRIEKLIELGGEIGEDWFDLVRYSFVDGFDISSVKPTATDINKYISPIPVQSINASNGVEIQNPGY